MCSFDQSIFALFERGDITQAEAIANADNKTDVTLRMRLAAGASLGAEGMQMAPNDEDAAPAAPH